MNIVILEQAFEELKDAVAGILFLAVYTFVIPSMAAIFLVGMTRNPLAA